MRHNCFYSLFFNAINCDYAHPFQVSFQDPATPVMEGIIALHHDLFFILILIGVSVAWMLFRTVFLFHHRKNNLPSELTHATTIEIIWTITPSLILMLIAVPSFALLYSMDEVIDPSSTIKVIGHQWYWSYEYSDYNFFSSSSSIQYDSYMVSDEDLIRGQLRLLDVDNRMIIPVNTHTRVLITSADVIHSWAIPSLGVKIDACPGRLNQVSLFIKRCSTFYGQCSELCGINHAFMPIVIQSVPLDIYVNWILAQSDLNTVFSKNLHING